MKQILIFIALFSTLQLFSQNETSKIDLRFGTGVSLLGSGDMLTIK